MITAIKKDTLSPADSVAVWDRLWRHQPSQKKDDALLSRERRNPRWAMILANLNQAFGSINNLKTIEIGSGRGDLSVLLAQQGAHVTLLDASDKALAQAKQRFDRLGLRAEYVRTDFMESVESESGGYDVSLSSGVIEHFVGAERTRSMFAHHNVLRPDGMTIISVPHAHCFSYRIWKAYLELRGWWPYGVEIPYAAREMRRRLVEAGFHHVETTAMGYWQSVGDHLLKGLLGKSVDWMEKRSCIDAWLGGTLLAFARRANGSNECSDTRQTMDGWPTSS